MMVACSLIPTLSLREGLPFLAHRSEGVRVNPLMELLVKLLDCPRTTAKSLLIPPAG